MPSPRPDWGEEDARKIAMSTLVRSLPSVPRSRGTDENSPVARPTLVHRRSRTVDTMLQASCSMFVLTVQRVCKDHIALIMRND